MSAILIADDEAIITMHLEESLTAMGYTVAGMAANGEAAVEKARSVRPDLVLMDIVMPGKMNGIEAAGIITDELGIPVVFVTSYADDTVIAKARTVRPAGYIVKPFNERELKAAIEVALFRASLEPKRGAGASGQAPDEGMPLPLAPAVDSRSLDLTRSTTILLDEVFSDIVLFLYTDPLVKEPVFRSVLEEGIRNSGRIFFAYFSATVQRHFAKEIQAGLISTRRLKTDDIGSLSRDLGTWLETPPADPDKEPLHVLLDFADSAAFDEILAVKRLLLAHRAAGAPVSGIVAADIGNLEHDRIAVLAQDIPRVIVSNGRDTTLSFAHHSFAAESVDLVPQETVDDIVKKSLEPVVLSLLDRPISGFDIVHEIHNRYKVLIPQARVYSLLYDLEQKGYLEIRHSGKSKLYCQTAAGRKYIPARLADFRSVYRHILGGNGSGK